MNRLAALIFDVDGTLADTEEAHRLAFNAAFRDAGLDWEWSSSAYKGLLAVTGGKERIRRFVQSRRLEGQLPADADGFIASLHGTKTQHYTRMLAEGRIALRPGVCRLIEEARAEGLRLGIATTTTPANVAALLEQGLGPQGMSSFDAIGAGDLVAAKKPAPDIYLWVMDALGLEPAECLALEDSRNGLLAASRGGIESILITPSAYTLDEDFGGASLVVDRLGDSDHPCHVLAGNLAVGERLSLADLRRLHSLVHNGVLGRSAGET